MPFRINRKQQQKIQIELKKRNALDSPEKAWMNLEVSGREDVAGLGAKNQREHTNHIFINGEFFKEKSVPENRFKVGLVKIQKVATVEEIKQSKIDQAKRDLEYIERSKKDIKEASDKKLARFATLPLDTDVREILDTEIKKRGLKIAI